MKNSNKILIKKASIDLENSLKLFEVKESTNDYHSIKINKIKEIKLEINNLISNYEYEDCIPLIKKLIFFDDKNSYNYYLMSDVLIMIGDVSTSLSYRKKGFKLESSDKLSENTIDLQIKNNNKLLNYMNFTKGIISLIKNLLDPSLLHTLSDNMDEKTFYYLSALSCIATKELNLAIENLTYILENIDKNNVPTLLLLAKLYLYLDDNNQSALYFWRVYYINPDNIEVQAFVKVMYNKMNCCINESEKNIKRNNLRCAMLWLNKGLRLFPNNPECLLAKSLLLIKINKSENISCAIDALNTAKNNLKFIKFSNGIYNDKLNYIKKSIAKVYYMIYYITNDINTKNTNTIFNVEILIEAIKLDSSNELYQLTLGDYYYKKNNVNNALNIYLKLSTSNKSNKEIVNRISSIQYKKCVQEYNSKNYLKSLESINYVLNNTFYGKDFYVLKSKCLLKLKDNYNALLCAQKALLLAPNDEKTILLIKDIKSS